MTATQSARPRPTMREVAALSGVSIKTVSRVVNNEPGVSVDLVERVQSAARTLNYQPNLTASNLRRNDGKTRTIGLVIENIANPFSSALHRAIENVARERGVVVFAGSVDEDPGRERDLSEAFIARRVDGLIIVPTGSDQAYLSDELRSGTAMVFVDRAPSFLDADCVVTDNTGGARAATEHLIAHGHHRIAFLGDLATITTARDRFAGYCDALAAAGIELEPAIVRSDLRTSESAADAVAELLAATDPPTAFFASQNLVTMGAVRALHSAGLQREIALVGFDEIPLVELLDPGVTLIVQQVAAMGATAADLLFRRLDGDSSPSQRCTLEAQLVVGGSGEIPGPYVQSKEVRSA